MHLLIMCLIYGAAAGAWDLMIGFAGVFSFAQIAFYVIGAYASAIITNHFGISPWLGIIAGGGIAAGTGLVIGLPCLRIKGSYVALLTFALHLLLEPLLKSEWGIAIGTGGTGGIISIPKLAVGGYTFSRLEVVPPFYTALLVSFAAFFIIYKVIHSRWGLAFGAIRDSEPLARSLGVDYSRYKLIVFCVSASLTGMIGAFYAHYIGFLSPRLLGLDMFLMLLVMQVIGGQGLFPGALIGSFIITFSSEYLRVMGVYRLVIFGAMVVALVAAMPKGIMGFIYSATGGERTARKRTPVHRIFSIIYCKVRQKGNGCIREDVE
jgi:branched-chain amino acid transport system permease protein